MTNHELRIAKLEGRVAAQEFLLDLAQRTGNTADARRHQRRLRTLRFRLDVIRGLPVFSREV